MCCGPKGDIHTAPLETGLPAQELTEPHTIPMYPSPCFAKKNAGYNDFVSSPAINIPATLLACSQSVALGAPICQRMVSDPRMRLITTEWENDQIGISANQHRFASTLLCGRRYMFMTDYITISATTLSEVTVDY